MRKEDVQAIKRTVALFKQECQQHEMCRDCKFYKTGVGCSIDKPPAFLDIDEILECFT